METGFIALLGSREKPTDGIEDYCQYLSEALSKQGITMKTERVDWENLGWVAALRRLRRQSADWRGSWVVLHYTALSWSRRGFPIGALLALSILRRRGARCAVMFHEPFRQSGGARIQALRGWFQDWVIRRLYSGSQKAIFADPLGNIVWLPSASTKAVFIPIGANLPSAPSQEALPNGAPDDIRTVAVFCLSGPAYRQNELGDIAHALQFALRQGVKARVVFVGRSTAEAKEEISRMFDALGVEAVNLGLRPATEVRRILAAADVMLCVRGRLYMRRGSAIAGIACGLPIVGYAGEAEGSPLEEAGIELVPYRDREALGRTLTTILADCEKRRELSARSWQAYRKYFSWDQIARSYAHALTDDQPELKVLVYSHYWAPSVGGVETFTTQLASGLSSRQSDKILVTVVTQTPAAGMDDRALPFRVVRQPGATELLRLVKDADVLHLAGSAFLPLLMACLLKKPVVVEHHGYQTICPNGLLIYGKERTVCSGHFMAGQYGKCIQCQAVEIGYFRSIRSTILTFFRRWLTKKATTNVVPSRHIGRRVDLPRTELIYHGVAAKEPESIVDSPAMGPFCFAFAGRLVPEKGADILIRAARQLSNSGCDFRVRIVGDGPERGRLERMSADFGLAAKVEFAGAVPAGKVDQALSLAQVVVMPSTWEDVAPLVVPEQMMQGRVLIASDIGGLGETVGEFGLRFPAGDAEALASRMRYVLENRSAVEELRQKARMHALACHSEKGMIDAHAALYRSVSHGRGRQTSVSFQDAEG